MTTHMAARVDVMCMASMGMPLRVRVRAGMTCRNYPLLIGNDHRIPLCLADTPTKIFSRTHDNVCGACSWSRASPFLHTHAHHRAALLWSASIRMACTKHVPAHLPHSATLKRLLLLTTEHVLRDLQEKLDAAAQAAQDAGAHASNWAYPDGAGPAVPPAGHLPHMSNGQAVRSPRPAPALKARPKPEDEEEEHQVRLEVAELLELEELREENQALKERLAASEKKVAAAAAVQVPLRCILAEF